VRNALVETSAFPAIVFKNVVSKGAPYKELAFRILPAFVPTAPKT